MQSVREIKTRHQTFKVGDIVAMFDHQCCYTDAQYLLNELQLDNLTDFYSTRLIPVGKKYKLIAIGQYFGNESGIGIFQDLEDFIFYTVLMNDHDMRRVY